MNRTKRSSVDQGAHVRSQISGELSPLKKSKLSKPTVKIRPPKNETEKERKPNQHLKESLGKFLKMSWYLEAKFCYWHSEHLSCKWAHFCCLLQTKHVLGTRTGYWPGYPVSSFQFRYRMAAWMDTLKLDLAHVSPLKPWAKVNCCCLPGPAGRRGQSWLCRFST